MVDTYFWEKEMTDELEKAFIDYKNKFGVYPDEYFETDPNGYNPDEFAWIIRDCIKKIWNLKTITLRTTTVESQRK